MIERRIILLSASAIIFVFISFPSVLFHNALKKYLNFMGNWSVATVKPSKISELPPTRLRQGKRNDIPQPELKFVKLSIKIQKASDIALIADFNRWDPSALKLIKKGKDQWEALVPLPPGKYRYLYLIDGQNILDPMNPDTETVSGKKVSVLTVK